MRDEEQRRPVARPRREQVVLQSHPRERVERVEGLVKQQHLRLGHERARERDPLRHSARELLRQRAGEGGELDGLERVADERVRVRPVALAETEGDVVGDVQPGKEPRLLEDQPDRGMRAAHELVPNADLAAVMRVETGCEAEERRLAAA